MIDHISGIVKHIRDKSVTVVVNGMGLSIATTRPEIFTPNQEASLHIYFHWNSDRGPTLYGFADELEKTVFMMIIDCHKIGPSVGLQILSQINAVPFLEMVAAQNIKALSSLNGIGAKKAEGIVTELKGKAAKLLASGVAGITGASSSTSHLPQVSEALTSLGYSKQEVSATLNYLAESFSDGECSFDKLIRSGLSYLSKNKSL